MTPRPEIPRLTMRRSPMWPAFDRSPIEAAGLVLLLAAFLVAGPAGCTGGDKGPPPSAPAPAGEVFESFDTDAFIEEETIVAPPEPAPAVAPPPLPGAPGAAPGLAPPPAAPGAPPPEERDRSNRALPLSSPGAAPAGIAPPQPSDVQ